MYLFNDTSYNNVHDSVNTLKTRVVLFTTWKRMRGRFVVYVGRKFALHIRFDGIVPNHR